MPKSYKDSTDGLIQGPRYKSDATCDLEKVILNLLAGKTYSCSYNPMGELEIHFGEEIFNITKILSHQADFEHIQLDPATLAAYVPFVKTAKHKPELLVDPTGLKTEKTFFPTEADYKRLDTGNNFAELTYSEKLAITLYSTEFYKDINHFLRSSGQDPTRALPQSELDQRVKEVLLAATIASHGLSKIEHKSSAAFYEEDETLMRGEAENAMLSVKRMDAYNNRQGVLRGDAFLSSAGGYLADNFSGSGYNTRITIIQPSRTINPMGKAIGILSRYPHEREVLFSPGVQLRYVDIKTTNNWFGKKETNITAVPVRSLNDIDPFSYSSQEMALRSQLLALSRDLINYKQNVKDTVFGFFSEKHNKKNIDKINIFTTLSMDIRKLIDAIDTQKHINLDDLVAMRQLILDAIQERTKLNGVQNSASIRLMRNTLAKIDNYHPLIKHIKRIQQQDNTNTAHAIRVMNYLPAVISYLTKFAKPPHSLTDAVSIKEAANAGLNFHRSEKEIEILQVMALFCSNYDDTKVSKPSGINPEQFRLERAEAFKIYAKQLGLDEADIIKYTKIVQYVGDTKYLESLSPTQARDERALLITLNMALNLDAMRYMDSPTYQKLLDDSHNDYIVASPEQKAALKDLNLMATTCIRETGEALTSQVTNQGNATKTTPANADVLNQHNQDPFFCMQACSKIASTYQNRIEARQLPVEAIQPDETTKPSISNDQTNRRLKP